MNPADSFYYHSPGKVSKKDKVLKNLYKPKVSVISKTLLSGKDLGVGNQPSDVIHYIMKNEDSQRQSSELTKSVLHLN